jgi:chemotaxis protein MotB
MARRLLIAALAGLSLTGCVSQEKYNALKIEKDQLVEQLGQSQSDASRANAAAEAWKSQYDKLIAGLSGKDDINSTLNKELAELRAQNASLAANYENALKDKGNIIGGPVSKELTSVLIELANQYPDIMSFDPATGMIKFKSDVTFAKGSAELTPAARTAIARVGHVLNAPMARGYEFLVAGHTDSTPISNPTTLRDHKDNWHLSSHRAIAVGTDLIKQGVASSRVGVLGYADQRPVASNGSPDGMARNRRVEILILPTSAKNANGNFATPAPRTNGARVLPAHNPVRPQQPIQNKDTTDIDNRPILNK